MESDDILDMKPMEGLGDFHLRSAVTKLDEESLKKGQGRFREQKAYNDLQRVMGETSAGDASRFLGRLFQRIGYERDNLKVVGLDHALRSIKAESTLFQEIYGSGGNNINNILGSEISAYGYEEMANFYILALISANAKASGRSYHEKQKSRGKEISGVPVLMDKYRCVYYLAGDIIGIKEPQVGQFLYSIDMFRMFTDKLTERNNVIISTQFGFSLFPDVYLNPSKLMEFWKMSDKILLYYGNKSYKLFKAFEALTWGVLLSQDLEELWEKDRFLLSTIDGLKEDFPLDQIMELVDGIRKVCSSPHHFSQLSGLFRLWGHPVVDPLAGLIKVRDVGNVNKIINTETVKISGRKIKEIFFANYYRKHGQYPPTKDESSGELLTLLSQNKVINLKDPNYHLAEWDEIWVDKIFDPPETFNLSLIVADTAISPTRTEIRASVSGRDVLSPHIRRGVLKFIRDGVINCKELLEDVNNYEFGLKSEFRIIGEYPKERELNPTPRMFALMTLVMRAYIVVTESMLGDILDYFPGITMVDDLLTLSKKMIASTREHQFRKPGSDWFVINIDFEKWNLNMRRQATEEVFDFLGRIFGLPHLYQRTYDIFENSIVYLADGSYLPTIDQYGELSDNDPRSYIGHLGGFEGLRQKGWTIFTMSLIAYVCDKEGVNFRLMGQGDNQVLMIEVFSREEQITGVRTSDTASKLTSSVSRIMNELIRVFDNVGLPMKPLETWVSSSLFLYGKVPIYKGVPLSMSLKRLSRVFPFSNEDLMTLDNAMSAISANAQSAAFYDISPVISYLCARWQQCKCINLFLSYHPLSGQAPFRSHSSPNWELRSIAGEKKHFTSPFPANQIELLFGLLYSFKSLGGTNGISIFHLILRGFPDPQSRDLCFLKSVFDSTEDHLIKRVVVRWMKVILSPETKRNMLIEDPTAFNLLVPPQTLSITKKLIRAKLKEAPVTSQFGAWFKELLKISSQDQRDQLIGKLLEGDHLFPRLSHDIYGATLYGYSDSILSKVDKTVTLSRISMRESKVDVVGILLKGEIRYLNYLWWRVSVVQNSDVTPHIIPSEFAQRIRNQSWGAVIEGVTVPFPHQLVVRKVCNVLYVHPPSPDVNYVSVSISEQVKNNVTQLRNSIGYSPPYLGSSTQEKLFSKHDRAIFGTEPLLKRPTALARLINWVVDYGSNYHIAIKRLISAVTDEDPDSFIEMKEKPGGSATHRYQDTALKHGALSNSLFGPGTHITMSTDFLHRYGKGSENVNLHFQALLCWIQSLTAEWIMSGEGLSSPSMTLHYHLREPSGLTTIEDKIPDLISPIDEHLIPSSPANPYLYVRSHQIAYRRNRFTQLRLTGRQLTISQAENQYNVNWGTLMHEMLAYKLSSKILGTQSVEEEVSGLFDIVGINRSFTAKVEISHLLQHIFAFLYWIIFKHAREAKPNQLLLFKQVKEKVVKRISNTDHQRFVDLCPIISDPKTKSELQAMELHMTPLGYPVSPKLLTLATKSVISSYCKSQISEPEIPVSGYLIDELSSNPVDYLKLLLMKRVHNSNVKCYYCRALLEQFEFNTAEEILKVTKCRCELGHLISRKHVMMMNWSRISITLDALIKLAPITDPIALGETLLSKLQWMRLKNKEHFKLSDIRNWVPKPQHPALDIKEDWSKISLFTAFGIHKIPTSGYARVYDAVCMAYFSGYMPTLSASSKILVIGDGFGYSSAILKKMTNALTIGWTYIRVDESTPHLFPHCRPPAHSILNMEGYIVTTPTGNLCSDITNPLWRASYTLIEEAYGKIDFIFSEIELRYTSDSLESWKLYFENLMYVTVKGMIIKLKQVPAYAIGLLMGFARANYHCIKIISGITHTGGCLDCWMLVKDRREHSSMLEFPSANDLTTFVHQYNFFIEMNQVMGESDRRIIDHINSSLSDTRMTTFYEDWIKNWFHAADLTLWDNENLTELWYEIKQGRRPKTIQDETGQTQRYAFDHHDTKLINRLMVLFLMRLSDQEYLTQCQVLSDWRLSWLVSSRPDDHRMNTWCLILHRSQWRHHKNVLAVTAESPPEVNDILRVIPYLRYSRKYRQYNASSEIVSFRYIRDLHRLGIQSDKINDVWDSADGTGYFEEGHYIVPELRIEEGQKVVYPWCFPISKRSGYSVLRV